MVVNDAAAASPSAHSHHATGCRSRGSRAAELGEAGAHHAPPLRLRRSQRDRARAHEQHGDQRPGRPSRADRRSPTRRSRPSRRETFAAGPTAWVPSDPSLLGFGLVECWSCVALPCRGAGSRSARCWARTATWSGSPGADEVGGAGLVDVDG